MNRLHVGPDRNGGYRRGGVEARPVRLFVRVVDVPGDHVGDAADGITGLNERQRGSGIRGNVFSLGHHQPVQRVMIVGCCGVVHLLPTVIADAQSATALLGVATRRHWRIAGLRQPAESIRIRHACRAFAISVAVDGRRTPGHCPAMPTCWQQPAHRHHAVATAA